MLLNTFGNKINNMSTNLRKIVGYHRDETSVMYSKNTQRNNEERQADPMLHCAQEQPAAFEVVWLICEVGC